MQWVYISYSIFRPELNVVALHPWTNVKIPEKVDVALEEVCVSPCSVTVVPLNQMISILS